MDDHAIIALYFKRAEEAITETRKKYGALCRAVAKRILESDKDAEEVESDTYLRVWNSIPPTFPERFRSYLLAICRHAALDRYDAERCAKRGGGVVALCVEELGECLSSENNEHDAAWLRDMLNGFLALLPEKRRKLFVGRYWYMMSVKELSRMYGMKESAVKMSLMRTREELRAHLMKEGYEV